MSKAHLPTLALCSLQQRAPAPCTLARLCLEFNKTVNEQSPFTYASAMLSSAEGSRALHSCKALP